MDGDKIIAEAQSGELSLGTTLYYFYDDNGSVMGFRISNNAYYYQKNIQGDVINICDAFGNVLSTYTYDAWGKVLSITGTNPSIGITNPFRYRGYYYDNETGWYYLNSRYYDPSVGRFISADTSDVITATMNSPNHDKNLYAYCDNNPVMRIDNGGEFWGELFAGIAIVAAVVAVAAVVVVTAGAAAPALAVAGSGMLAGGFGLSAATVATITTVAYASSAIAIGSAVVTGVAAGSQIMNKKRTNKNKTQRPEQKRRGSEDSEKKKNNDDWRNDKYRTPKIPKKHTPSKQHQKY